LTAIKKAEEQLQQLRSLTAQLLRNPNDTALHQAIEQLLADIKKSAKGSPPPRQFGSRSCTHNVPLLDRIGGGRCFIARGEAGGQWSVASGRSRGRHWRDQLWYTRQFFILYFAFRSLV
jgi:hypothetical protein